MSGRNLLQRVSQPAGAAPEREQSQWCLPRKIENVRERREGEVDVGSLTDGLFHNASKLRVSGWQRKVLQQRGCPRVPKWVKRMPESGNRAALRKPIPYRHVSAR